MLADILDYAVVDDFCASVLKRIRDHDAANGSPLMPTVVSLVRHGGRLQPAVQIPVWERVRSRFVLKIPIAAPEFRHQRRSP